MNTYKHYSFGVPIGTLFLLALPLIAFGGEIQQHSITAARGGEVLVRSHTPSGDTEYRCALNDGECNKAMLDGQRFFNPTILGTSFAELSQIGTYGVAQQVVNFGLAPIVFYRFYDLTGDTPSFAGLVSVTGTVVKTSFSPGENAYIIVMNDGTVIVYDIQNREKRTINLDQTDIPYFSISQNGTYISTYNYIIESHKLFNTKTNELILAPGEPSFVEFSENEKEAAFIIKRNGYRNLATIALDNTHVVTQVATGEFLVEDYTYLNNNLYYLANNNHPLEWSLFNANTDEKIDDDVSYNVYLTRYNDKLVYGKIQEKNTDLYAYNGAESVRINATPLSYRNENLIRETARFDGKTAAVIMPEDISRGDLYIWLHGGPRRQASLGYHPYLSYAVYDELLEDLASAGNYVVKLDYSGSWGYGDDFIDTLKMNVGVVEIADVRQTINTFKEEHQVRNVYLIGNSYGGYMAFRGLNALTNDVDGIISINGVADWYGLVQSIPSSPFKDLFGGVPSLSTLPLYLSASAFTNYKDINGRKMLVIYGSEDKTVPANQSKQYAEFMDANDKDVTLVELTGAEHVITRRENITQMCESIRDIFEDDLNCSQ